MAKKPTIGTINDDTAGIGMLPDGKLNVVNKDDPPFRPTIVDDDGNVVEMGDEDED